MAIVPTVFRPPLLPVPGFDYKEFDDEGFGAACDIDPGTDGDESVGPPVAFAGTVACDEVLAVDPHSRPKEKKLSELMQVPKGWAVGTRVVLNELVGSP